MFRLFSCVNIGGLVIGVVCVYIYVGVALMLTLIAG